MCSARRNLSLIESLLPFPSRVPPPTMTLPSLCSAIRSQLYFSQIVAWCDLLRKGDPSVYESGRVIFANGSTSNAGDLAGLGSAIGAAAAAGRRPRLNIFYRIRPHDVNAAGNHNDGGFSGKANVHNFPHVNIAENFSVAVCVKSLPRINGGLPHIAPAVSKPRMPAAASTPTGGGGMCAATPTGLGARIVISTTPPPPPSSSSAGSSIGSCDKSMERQRIAEEETLAEDHDHDDLDGHRERQLLKYRKRMLRRDKKRERKPSDQLEPMDEGGSEEMSSLSPAPEQSAMVMTLTAAPRRIAMISTGTQTSLSSCQQCGSEKTLLCLNCVDDEGKDVKGREAGVEADEDDDDTSASEMEDTSSCSLSSSDLIVGTPRNKAELLLQAIQRTPKNRKPNNTNNTSSSNNNTSKPGGVAGNDLKKKPEPVQQQQQHHPGQNNNQQHKPTAPMSGCQVCKRQKTQHNFSRNGQGGSNGNDNSMEQEEEQVSSIYENVSKIILILLLLFCSTPS